MECNKHEYYFTVFVLVSGGLFKIQAITDCVASHYFLPLFQVNMKNHPHPHFLQLAGFHSECPDFYTSVPLLALSQCDCYISGVTPRYNEPVKPGGASSPVLCLAHLYLAPTFLIDVYLLPILQGVRVNESNIL